jgi:protein-tyrosine phosphatase
MTPRSPTQLGLVLAIAVGGLAVTGVSVHAKKPRDKAKASSPHPRKVLFVCTGNYYRSRFAQALFNEKPPEDWTAFSRGLDTSTPREVPVSPLVSQELERRHIPASRVAGWPTQIAKTDLDDADVVVLLDGSEHAPMLRKQFPAQSFDKVRSWSVADTPPLTPTEAFAAITRQVDALVEELSHEGKKAPAPMAAPETAPPAPRP